MNKAILFFALLLAAACTSAPIISINNTPITANKQNFTIEDVESGIFRAGIGLGWVMAKTRLGVIEGTLHKNDHVVEVTISYNIKEYSISYKNSQNMDYSSGKIHKAYNRWVQDLNIGIQKVLSSQL